MNDCLEDNEVIYYGLERVATKKGYRKLHVVKIKDVTYNIKANNKHVAIKRAYEKWRMRDFI